MAGWWIIRTLRRPLAGEIARWRKWAPKHTCDRKQMKLIAQNIMLRCGDFCILGWLKKKRIVQEHSVDLLWDFVSGRDVGAPSLKWNSWKQPKSKIYLGLNKKIALKWDANKKKLMQWRDIFHLPSKYFILTLTPKIGLPTASCGCWFQILVSYFVVID